MAKEIDITRGHFQISKEINKAVENAKKKWQKKAPKIIMDNIKESIARGNSPVKGEGRFAKYSDSYKKAMKTKKFKKLGKKEKPVNLKLTGKMLKTLTSRNTLKGFVIYFTSKLAKIHSEQGAGKSKTIRKITPTGNEKFKSSITKEATDMLGKLLDEALRKL